MTSVLIVSKYPLFGQGVERLLRQELGMTVVGVESDVSAALQTVAELKPDIVILDSNDPNCDPAPILTHVLRGKERVTIIGLNLSDNLACMCGIEHRMVKDVSDLLDIVRPAVSVVGPSVFEGHV
jgi:DNA-binding NarL/FixJ family response regulator